MSNAPEPAPSSAGLELDWDPAAMVDEVYVDPYAQEYFAEAVRAIVGWRRRSVRGWCGRGCGSRRCCDE